MILTPHIGGSTLEAQYNIGVDVSTKLINLIDNGTTVGSHSVPPLNLPVQKNAHRILHIHENKPGVLSEINRCLSDSDINILGQYLKTNEHIGYVVLDIDKEYDDEILEDLNNVKHTIRTRILKLRPIHLFFFLDRILHFPEWILCEPLRRTTVRITSQ